MQEAGISRRAKLLIFTGVLASLLEIIDTSIVNVAIPTMMGNLGSTLEDISWVVTGYIIANAIVLPIAGWLGVQFGRKSYYTGCILLFTATSVGCGLAPNLTVLVIFRVLQGLAGGALLPTSQAIIQEAFPREKAGMASAIYGMSVMIGPTIGPTLGGYLTDNFGWRSIFNINLPLGILAAIMSYAVVEDVGFVPGSKVALEPGQAKPKRVRPPVDFIGLGLLAMGIGTLQFVLERGEADEWFASAAIVICAILAVISIPAFIWWELVTDHPIMDLRLYKHTAVKYGTILMGVVGAMLYSLIFVVPIFSSRIVGLTATDTGELFIPGALLAAMFMPFIGGQLRKRDPRILIAVGILCLEIAILMMSRFTSQTTTRDMFLPLLVRGAGMAFLFVPINTVVLGQFRGAQLGQVAGMMNLSRQLGGSIGIAALSTLLSHYNAQNYLNVVSHVSLLDHTTYQVFQQTKAGMSLKMSSQVGFSTPVMSALKSLSFRVQQQVFMLSFTQMLGFLLFSFALSFIPLARLNVPRVTGGPVDAH